MDPETEAAAHWKAHLEAEEVVKAALGEERYHAYCRRKLGREYVAECEQACRWAGVDPAAPPAERREAILAKLREALSLPEGADALAIDAVCRGMEWSDPCHDLLQLACNPGKISAEDAGRVYPLFEESPLSEPARNEPHAAVEGGAVGGEAGAGQPDPPLTLLQRCQRGEKPLAEIAALFRQDREILHAALGYVVKTEPACGDTMFAPRRSKWHRDF